MARLVSIPRMATSLPGPHAATGGPESGGAVVRLVGHGLVGWAICAATGAPLFWATSLTLALVGHAVVVATIFALVAWHYARAPGAREPLIPALTFAAIVAGLNLAVAGLVEPSQALFDSVFGFWSPVLLVFGVTGIVAEFVGRPVRAKAG
jgi:hypothetical protein